MANNEKDTSNKIGLATWRFSGTWFWVN